MTGSATERLLAAAGAVLGEEGFRVSGDPESVESPGSRALARTAHREAKRQRNIERILELALAGPTETESELPLRPDWMDLFFRLAQDVGEAEAQAFWARVLAKETSAPGFYSRRSLVALSQMDEWELAGFSEYCAFVFAFESGWRFLFDESLTRQEMWSYVRGNDLTQHFIGIGLLAPEPGVLSGSSRGLRVNYFDRVYEIAATEAENPGAVGYRKFSPTGQQLAAAVRVKPFNGYARNLIKRVREECGVALEAVEVQPS
ncbi:DUF2806 domain-containing protein [Methylococcus sp. Mc7]|uniref:DUF2806 domain-containing protein n=1 Tax=Methylococcus sp. Mc7 TaxID=2860258 RepID=UPI001C533709|nr:DUF2806 domain-containing protein [Methylococcus sp. Mc7]QXP84240.1 DUF2806 domain-containing protein [Methylococcus sp. Mc7]